MNPWPQPYYGALEVLIPSKQLKSLSLKTSANVRTQKKSPFDRDSVQKPYQKFLDSGSVEIEVLCLIRGRSIVGRLFILGKAQQLTLHEVNKVIGSISKRSKIVLIGDPALIDNPYIESGSNGLVFCFNRMIG
jgi:PhoH-like ATPase